MPKNTKLARPLRFFLETTGFHFAMALLRIVPPKYRASFYGATARRIGTRMRLQNRIYKNLDIGLPGLSETQKAQIADGVWSNLGRSYAELTMGPQLSDLNNGIVEIENLEAYEAIKARGQGTILIGAHFSNWELTILSAARLVKDFHGFYRVHDNKHMDAQIHKLRSTTGAGLIPKNDRQGLKHALKLLREGGTVGILVDQHFAGGDQIAFMGVKTGTLPMAYSLAKSTGAALLPFHLVRQPDQTYKGIFGEEFDFPTETNPKLARTRLLTEINAEIGNWVREHPEQWLWLHNRWRAEDLKSRFDDSEARKTSVETSVVGD